VAVPDANGADPLRSASGALDDAYRHVAVKPGKGVDHAREVARVLRAAGCAEPVQVAGLLHDVVEDTAWTLDDVSERFGRDVAVLVAAVTEDRAISSYRRRKRALRERIALGGPAAVDIALADKVASLRYALASGKRVPKRKLAHYGATLALGTGAAHPGLATEVADLLSAIEGRDESPFSVA
jgi:(p)ppGpp synthase/HD superfamily hydrolase